MNDISYISIKVAQNGFTVEAYKKGSGISQLHVATDANELVGILIDLVGDESTEDSFEINSTN